MSVISLGYTDLNLRQDWTFYPDRNAFNQLLASYFTTANFLHNLFFMVKHKQNWEFLVLLKKKNFNMEDLCTFQRIFSVQYELVSNTTKDEKKNKYISSFYPRVASQLV